MSCSYTLRTILKHALCILHCQKKVFPNLLAMLSFSSKACRLSHVFLSDPVKFFVCKCNPGLCLGSCWMAVGMKHKTDVLPLLHQLLWFKSLCAVVARPFIWPLFDPFPISPRRRASQRLALTEISFAVFSQRSSHFCVCFCSLYLFPLVSRTDLLLNAYCLLRIWTWSFWGSLQTGLG